MHALEQQKMRREYQLHGERHHLNLQRTKLCAGMVLDRVMPRRKTLLVSETITGFPLEKLTTSSWPPIPRERRPRPVLAAAKSNRVHTVQRSPPVSHATVVVSGR